MLDTTDSEEGARGDDRTVTYPPRTHNSSAPDPKINLEGNGDAVAVHSGHQASAQVSILLLCMVCRSLIQSMQDVYGGLLDNSGGDGDIGSDDSTITYPPGTQGSSTDTAVSQGGREHQVPQNVSSADSEPSSDPNVVYLRFQDGAPGSGDSGSGGFGDGKAVIATLVDDTVSQAVSLSVGFQISIRAGT